MQPLLRLAGFAMCACFAASWALACDDGGSTTSCAEMPLADAGDDVPSSDPEVRAWWERAVDERCATPPIGGFAGAAGAPN
jgi:hypothetical protein